MLPYRERLTPSLWIYLSTALVIPASLLVFLPISPLAGVITAIVLYCGAVAALVFTSPVIEVNGSEVTAGRARLPIGFTGDSGAFRGAAATLERGRQLDARAWVVIRGWVGPVVKITVLDTEDPAPYWLVSSRSPERMIAAIDAARDAAAQRAKPSGT